MTAPRMSFSTRPPPGPAGALTPSATTAGGKWQLGIAPSGTGSVGAGAGCGPGLPGSIPSTCLALQKEGRSQRSQPAATSPPRRGAGRAAPAPERSLRFSIAPVCPRVTGSAPLQGGSLLPLCPRETARGDGGWGPSPAPWQGYASAGCPRAGGRAGGRTVRVRGSGRCGRSLGRCWGARPAPSPLKVQGCIAGISPGGQTPGPVNTAQAGTCPLPPATGHPATSTCHGPPAALPQPGRAGGPDRHSTWLRDGGSHGHSFTCAPRRRAPSPSWMEPCKRSGAQGAGVRGGGTRSSVRAGESSPSPPGPAGQPRELCQRFPRAGVADGAQQKATAQSPREGQGGEGWHCVSPWE